jgi:hypothetical protein
MLSSACLIVASVWVVSGFTRSNTVSDAARSSVTAAQVYVPNSVQHVELPNNLVVAPVYQSVVDTMRRRSPTFRRQCLRVASSPKLSIVLQPDLPPTRSRARAWTSMLRGDGGRLHAVIEIGNLSSLPELIAHEMEHVIEQLDGIDLSAKARLPLSGVRRCLGVEGTVFETTRAVAIGERVAHEVSEDRP